MRKFSLFLAVLMIFTISMSVIVSADADKKAIVSYGTAVVDGDVDEVWNNVEGYKTTNVYQGAERITDTVSEWKLMWDENNLYVLIVVTDSEVNSMSETFWQNDCTQFFIDFANSSDFDLYDYDGMGSALGIRFPVPGVIEAPNDFQVELMGGGGYLYSDDPEVTSNFKYAYKKTDTGYNMEYSFDPRKFYADFKLEAGSKGGVDFINDDSMADSPQRDILYHWSLEGNTWGSPANLSVFELAAKVEAPVEETTEAAAVEVQTEAETQPPVVVTDTAVTPPPTGDMSIALFVIALIASCIVFVRVRKAR